MIFEPSAAVYGMLRGSTPAWAAVAVLLVLFFGGSVGSFVAAAARRLLDGRSVIGPRSHCESCGSVLGARDLVPLVSFLLLQGRCGSCNEPLERSDFLVEWIGALVAVLLLVATTGGVEFWRGSCLLVILGIATITDLEARRIPLPVSWSGIIMGLVWAAISGAGALGSHLLALVITVGVLAGLNAAYVKLRRVEVAFGGGDVRLAGAIAAFLGPEGAPIALIVAATAGSLFGIVAILLGRATLRSAIPFGPFLALGGALVVFGEPALWGLLSIVD